MTKAAEVILASFVQDAEIIAEKFTTFTENDPFGTGDSPTETTIDECELYIELKKSEIIEALREWITEEGYVLDEEDRQSFVRFSDIRDLSNLKEIDDLEYEGFGDLTAEIRWV